MGPIRCKTPLQSRRKPQAGSRHAKLEQPAFALPPGKQNLFAKDQVHALIFIQSDPLLRAQCAVISNNDRSILITSSMLQVTWYVQYCRLQEIIKCLTSVSNILNLTKPTTNSYGSHTTSMILKYFIRRRSMMRLPWCKSS